MPLSIQFLVKIIIFPEALLPLTLFTCLGDNFALAVRVEQLKSIERNFPLRSINEKKNKTKELKLHYCGQH